MGYKSSPIGTRGPPETIPINTMPILITPASTNNVSSYLQYVITPSDVNEFHALLADICDITATWWIKNIKHEL